MTPTVPHPDASPEDFFARFAQENPVLAAGLAGDTRQRLASLAGASPLYARLLLQHPGWVAWIEAPQNLRTDYRHQALSDEWRTFVAGAGEPVRQDPVYLGALRRFRRKMTLRFAYRSVNGFASEQTTVRELTRLAEFCVRECCLLAQRQAAQRHGEPWDEALLKPARFGVLALGKLGGEELNFSSDIDVLYLYEGEGCCHREGRPGALTNPEFFTKLAETLTTMLQEQTADGFLFRVDARLRPEGAGGPLVRSLASLENYYATAGQTWERLALLKARPVAGDLALGAELLESLHSFRYPRHPPPSLLDEIAAMKQRTEKEVVGAAALHRDVKSGYGGIREIEFIAQSFQLLHAGRFPFLQTHSTVGALAQLARYGLLPADEAAFLQDAYWFLRQIEHRLQMREEHQTHELPDDPAGFAAVARSLGFASAEGFRQKLELERERVHAAYDELFLGKNVDRELDAWWTFFTGKAVPPPVAGKLRLWFGGHAEAADRLRLFVLGGAGRLVNRELIVRFLHLARSFDAVIPGLAQPLPTLQRIALFAERYGTRQQFFNACAANPQLFRAIALLFDRSTFIHELLCAHPEILEEVLRPEILLKKKDAGALAAELADGPAGEGFAGWLWLYVKAEQVRHVIGGLLGFFSPEEMEAGLSLLADAVLRHALAHVDPAGRLVPVALGKYGGAELSFGSDLDVMFLAGERDAPSLAPALRELRKLFARGGPLGAAFELDLRLRPHGEAGPEVVTLSALAAYHAGSAQSWERQLLTRARVIAGPPALAAAFGEFVARLLYSGPLSAAAAQEIWAMRLRIETERDPVVPPERACKTGAGGLVDFEFLTQFMQLLHGHARPSLRQPGTRRILRELDRLGLLDPALAGRLMDNYDFLRRVEACLRCDVNRSTSVIGATPADRTPLARWLGFPDETTFWDDHCRRLHETRAAVLGVLEAANFSSQP